MQFYFSCSKILVQTQSNFCTLFLVPFFTRVGIVCSLVVKETFSQILSLYLFDGYWKMVDFSSLLGSKHFNLVNWGKHFLRNEHKLYNWPLYLATDLYTAQVSRCSCHSALSFCSQITFISFVTFQFAKSTFLYFLGYLFVHLCFNVSFWELKIKRAFSLVVLYSWKHVIC